MKADKKQLVGLQMPGPLYQNLNLLSLSQKTSRSAVIRDALVWYIHDKKLTPEPLIEVLREDYQTRWLEKKSKLLDSQISDKFEEYKRTAKVRLTLEHIEDETISRILDFSI